MRPCPTCQCFVPVAADHCPRCAADLDPVESVESRDAHEHHEERDAGRDASDRELILVGAGNVASPLTGSGHGDVVTRSVLARVALPPIDGPAGRPRRPTLPKLPQPFARDPLIVAACLGIPMLEPVAPIAPAPIEIVEKPTLAPDTFSALLGTPREDLPAVKPAVAPTPKPVPPVATPLVALPVATEKVHSEPLTPPIRRSRFWRRDPFVRRTTRRERILTRICLLLVLALALSVVVLRLPLGPRPELDASALGSTGSAVSTPASTPVADSMRLQTRADLRGTLLAAATAYPVYRTYAVATPTLLRHSLPELTFVTGTHPSRRIGEVSVASTAHRVVLAEYAGPGECAFARIVDRGEAESTVGPSGAQCKAAAAPANGWSPMTAS